jgi:hypothetical protein
MTEQEMLKQDLERAVKELEIDGSNTKQKVKYLLEECLETYFKPKKYLKWQDMEITNHYLTRVNGKTTTVIRGKNDSILLKNKDVIIFFGNDEFTFFNDLHLELVE